ncbi:MAG TPA: SDR family oxidoreductase [Tepidiformaceae bacterium]
MPNRLAGKVATITGAASGFGAAGAIKFAAEGAKVVVADLNEVKGKEVVEQIRASGGEAFFVRTDVTSEADTIALAAAAVDRYGKLDIVWANAGMAHGSLAIPDISIELFHKVFDVNVLGPFLTVRASIPALQEAQTSSVIITASLSGIKARPNLSAYQASKGAAIMLSRSFAIELAPIGVRVNSICPVAAETPMLPVFLEGMKVDGQHARAGLAAALPLGRLAVPEDIANGALFLASDESSLITGAELNIDAGARL